MYLHVNIVSAIVVIKLHEAVAGSTRREERLVGAQRRRTHRRHFTVGGPDPATHATVAARRQSCTIAKFFYQSSQAQCQHLGEFLVANLLLLDEFLSNGGFR